MEEYPLSVREATVQDKDITIVGVEHELDFFLENEAFFETLIRENDALVFEQPVEGRFWRTPFFQVLSDLAYLQKKNIYLVDPINSISDKLDYGLCIGGASLFAFEVATISSRSIKKNISRRRFLKKFIGAGAGASLFLGSTPGLALRASIDEESAVEYGMDDYFLTYGETDFRNLRIGLGIENICQNVSDVSNLLVVHGDLHSGGIHAYLTNPELRAKRLLYFPYEIIGRDNVREYTPNETEQWEWTLAREF